MGVAAASAQLAQSVTNIADIVRGDCRVIFVVSWIAAEAALRASRRNREVIIDMEEAVIAREGLDT